MSEVLQPDPAGLERAAEQIKSGGLIAFPTETVYGLGADASNDTAVARIYAAKGRPSFNPLIIHVPSLAVAEKYVVFSEIARRLADSFWPGALTLVLPRTADCAISKLASAGLDTLAIRVPGHRLALKFLSKCGRPLAAPSANPSGSISPTTAQHVINGLGNAISGVLEGGACPVGVESTVVGFENDTPVLLRPGGVTKEALESAVGKVLLHSDNGIINSPGMLLSHYAPACPVRLNAKDKKPGEAYLGFGRDQDRLSDINLSESGDLTEATARLFAAFHMLDEMHVKGIAVGPIPEIGLGVAINDRLRRAAAPRN
ncbi:L-threonylcarbamoyladenylate synthase [Sneathiella marina]|uniref:Threonylcarbamoyl-AMP synthase n=1 Tax=Sneathiella marina TaxID=2950108 RepID=A0ABY4W787_9PROT|nr:L-threonylcarbamoyladenylate synthase [Sneathiella marina]USG62913.1 L-threonylcarbamoyladenylate synthase [Sneathiella marina]